MFSFLDMLGPQSPMFDVVDVGAMWLGEESVPYRELVARDRCRVVGFEPVQAECDKLNAMGRRNHKYLPYFVGDGSEREFVLTNTVMTSSLYEPNTPLLDRFVNLGELVRPVAREKVSTRRLDDIPELSSIDFIKIDVQGAELDVLRGMERLLTNTLVVECEVEFLQLYKDQPLFGDIDRFMRAHGFEFHTFQALSGRCFQPMSLEHPAAFLRQTLWSDAIYVKNFMNFASLTPEQLLKTAVLLHEIYQSYDFAALALQHLDAKAGTTWWNSYVMTLTGGQLPPKPQL